MELRAILELLRAIPQSESLVLQTDSQYAMNVFTKWLPRWKAKGMKTGRNKRVENQDLILAIDEALVGRDVTFEWVRGHCGHDLNEAADALANAAARRAGE
jgi:ribonuclease HI